MYLDEVYKQTKDESVKDVKKDAANKYKKGVVEAKKMFNANLIERSENKCKTA